MIIWRSRIQRKFPAPTLKVYSAGLVLGFLVACNSITSSPISTVIANPQNPKSLPTATHPVPLPDSPGNLTLDQITTLTSLQKVDDYPLYTMEYIGLLPEEDFISNSDVLSRNSVENQQSFSGWGCSLFAALGDGDSFLVGRNFDWNYSPGLLLFTNPPDGYATVSMVDIAYLGFDEPNSGKLKELELNELTPLLDAVNWPFDGMNAQGLAISMAAVPGGQMKFDPQKPSIGSLQIMRQVLNHAATINQAIEIIKSYNIDFRGGPDLHYLIADTSGDAILIEFFEGEMHIIPNSNPWHQATNFIVSSVSDPLGQCSRYDKISRTMVDSRGSLTTNDSINLLSSVSQNNTQWSVIYHLQSGIIDVIMGRQFNEPQKFQLKP